jgi:hypothetical protein
VEITYTNPIIVAQLSDEGMAWIPKSTLIKILKDYDFTRTRV